MIWSKLTDRMRISIIIVTRNRARDLKQTLKAMREVEVADGMEAELLVVDNGSSDETAAVVAGCETGKFPVRYICEPRPGQASGRNRGLAETQGEMILFTDDDVRPPADWVLGMCEPMAQGKAEAVCGGVRLAPHLLRPWMTPMHRSWLASTEWITPGGVQSMVGANMAFSRSVLQRVPGFDPELGPGAAGFDDDGLFAAQLLAAGYRIHECMNVWVEHHFERSRLQRESWLSAARRRAESHAYRGHHWEHWRCRFSRLKALLAESRLALWRAGSRGCIREEGCFEAELDLVYQVALTRRLLQELKRERNYERRGLEKLH